MPPTSGSSSRFCSTGRSSNISRLAKTTPDVDLVWNSGRGIPGRPRDQGKPVGVFAGRSGRNAAAAVGFPAVEPNEPCRPLFGDARFCLCWRVAPQHRSQFIVYVAICGCDIPDLYMDGLRTAVPNRIDRRAVPWQSALLLLCRRLPESAR